MPKVDVIIIGAGACGLMAAYDLSKSGKRVLILEARNRVGGRIHTIHDDMFLMPIETGAEFIHGEFPLTISLLKEAGIKYNEMEGKMFSFRDGELDKSNSFIEDSQLLEKRMNELEHDMSVNQFLDTYFPGEKYNDLRESTRGFVEGYDAADADKASTIAFREEWNSGSMTQYRIEGGYTNLINYMKEKCEAQGVQILLGKIVTDIKWNKSEATVNDSFKASKIIITVPPSLLTSAGKNNYAINFSPSIPDTIAAFGEIGYGTVIKFNLQFKEAFWKSDVIEKRLGKSLEKMSFLFSDAEIPTWWTQYPNPVPMLTGWFAGPKAEKQKDLDEKHLLEKALSSLAFIFRLNVEVIREKLIAWHVSNWGADAFSLGAYSYPTLTTAEAKKELVKPIQEIIYFAGEALDNGNQPGTVEAALKDGRRVAAEIAGQQESTPG
jgi:monoamine oxidase